MPTNPRELKDLARSLLENEPSEVAVRAAVSRAYYAAFHAALPIAGELPESASSRREVEYVTHEELISRLFEWRFPPTHAEGWRNLKPLAARTAREMQAIRAFRVRADYRLDERISREEAKAVVLRVETILRTCKQVQVAAKASDQQPAGE